VTVDRGRYSPQSPTLETLRRIGSRASERAHRTKTTHIYPGVKTRGIALLLRNDSHPEGTFLKTRVDSYILGALSSWPLFVVASSVLTDE
jgi:hypothetical protein